MMLKAAPKYKESHKRKCMGVDYHRVPCLFGVAREHLAAAFSFMGFPLLSMSVQAVRSLVDRSIIIMARSLSVQVSELFVWVDHFFKCFVLKPVRTTYDTLMLAAARKDYQNITCVIVCQLNS